MDRSHIKIEIQMTQISKQIVNFTHINNSGGVGGAALWPSG